MATARPAPESTAEFHTPARVAIDARYLNGKSSGIGRYTENLVRQLLELDDALKIHLITTSEQPDPVPHARVTTQTFPGAPNGPITRLVLGRWIDWSDIDLFHSPFNSLPGGVPVPEVYTLHDIMWLFDPDLCMPPGIGQFFSKWYYRLVMPRSVAEAEHVFTVSKASRDTILERFPEKEGRVHVSYNAVDPDFKPVDPDVGWNALESIVPRGSRFVLIVGQGSPYKNHEGALDGFLRAFADDPDVYMVMVRRLSRSPSARWKALTNDPRCGDRIVRLDYVSFDQLLALYSLARAFVFPSFYEGFGLPQLEAMACGTPSVTSNYGAMAEIAGEASITVDPKAPDAIAEGLRTLVYDDEEYTRRRELSLKRAEAFTWQEAARRTLRIYREILNYDD
jgi:glycosyltransferase involved in cell wall biosynthesis